MAADALEPECCDEEAEEHELAKKLAAPMATVRCVAHGMQVLATCSRLCPRIVYRLVVAVLSRAFRHVTTTSAFRLRSLASGNGGNRTDSECVESSQTGMDELASQ